MNGQKLEQMIKPAESPGGKPNLRAYQDEEGVWTAGYGRNLQAMTITPECAENWIQEDIYTAHMEAQKFPEYKSLDTDARQNAFIELSFNLGAARLRGFVHMLAAIARKDWETAANELLASKWAGQVKKDRAQRLAGMLRTGEFPA